MKNKEKNLLCHADSSALMVIDVQTHLTAIMPAKVLARLQRNMGLMLHAAKLLNIPVFATEQYPQGLGNLEQEIVNLLPASAKRYEKTSFSCTGAENFNEDLKAAKRKQIILSGMEAHVCVIQTALALVEQEYQVFVVADAICSRHRESYETALVRLRSAGVTVLDAESVVFEWLGDSRNEHFKALQAIIR